MNPFTLIMQPLYYSTSAVLVVLHGVFASFLGSPDGASWALSIIALTVALRAALIPLSVRQIQSRRRIARLQPRLEELGRLHAGDRVRLREANKRLRGEVGVGPYALAVPLVIQLLVSLALFRLVNTAAGPNAAGIGVLNRTQALSLQDSTVFGGARLTESLANVANPAAAILAGVVVVLIAGAAYATERALQADTYQSTLDTMHRQRVLLYVLPAVFVVGAIAFPIAVMLSWLTSSLVTLAETLYVIRTYPSPDTPL